LKNARGSTLSASPAVPSVQKMREEWGWAPAERFPSAGSPAGLKQNFNTEAKRWNLRMSVELPNFMCLLFWCVSLH